MQPDLQPVQNSYATPISASQVISTEQKVLRNTYMLLALSMVPTGIGAMIGVNMNFGFLRASPMLGAFAMLAIVYGMFYAIEKNRDSGLGVGLLLGLTLFLGVMLGPVLHLTICAAFVLFSSMMILWQVSEIIHGGERNYISATLTLYMSIYNLFTSLLQLLTGLGSHD